jgi:hypothetical protein
MTDYGRDLEFGVGVEPLADPPGLGRTHRKGRRPVRPGPRGHPGPSLPAALSGYLDAHRDARSRNRTRPLLPRRGQFAAASAGYARQGRRQPRRALRRKNRDGPRRWRLLGRRGRHGRPAQEPGRGRPLRRGGHKGHAPSVERRTFAPLRRRVLFAKWNEAGPPSGPQHRRLGRGLRAADAEPHRVPRRWLGALIRLLTAGAAD